ncbi:hypothetical protein Sulku_1099 [Sulfuricurvum kujiense DSM 16994]|uniref:Uncharacterized protein n=1 Tax=Sulfuricurvum kujiense (strain ATCC BAA-921 / DSM 16994 / JCM 11577 / YK-1) TaxID=709032 RepID=E4TWE4_SULKY|nr:hypothetical protein [Sulfuricurvum kujiense]ADR33762.1 hypothetical protein Sulku_1099 [Sulfuricurvum kujiense DSM 16994]
MARNSISPKVILLKGNGGITINNEMMELLTITLAHGCIGLPLKALYAENIYIVKDRETFWEIHKQIKEKPCCFVHAIDGLDEDDMKRIKAQNVTFV